MSDFNPIDIFNRENQNLENQDIFYRGLVNHHIYVEDYKKAGIYEEIIKVSYPEISFIIHDNLSGKSDILRTYFSSPQSFENRSSEKFWFLLDKDFDDKCPKRKKKINDYEFCYEDLIEIEQIKFLKKYSIENYFLDQTLVRHTTKFSCSCKDCDLENYEENYDKVISLFNSLSKLYMINSCFGLGIGKIPISQETFDFINLELINNALDDLENNLEIKYKEKKDKFKNEITCIENISFSDMKIKVSNVFKENIDLVGKEALIALVKMNEARISVFNQKKIDDFFRHLIGYAQFKAPHIFDELRNDLNLI